MGYASSDDECKIEVREEEVYTLFQESTFDSRTIASGLPDDQVGDQHVLSEDIVAFAGTCCEELGLTGADREGVLQTAQLPFEFIAIRLYAHTLALSNQAQTNQVDSFLSSREFKETVTRRLQASLLDPHISYYVDGTTARFVRHINENPSAYEIPIAVRASFMYSKQFSSAVSKVLNNFRGQMQRKQSILDKEDVVTLASRLAIDGFLMDKDHILRVAFLRMYYMEFTGKIAKPGQSSNDKNKTTNKPETKFWSFIDTKLEKLRRKPLKDQLSALERNLTKDKRMFPGNATILSIPAPEWQISASLAVSAMNGNRIVTSGVKPHVDETGSRGNGQTPDSGRPLPIATPNDTVTGTVRVRRADSHEMGVRSSTIRHNPIGKPSRRLMPPPGQS